MTLPSYSTRSPPLIVFATTSPFATLEMLDGAQVSNTVSSQGSSAYKAFHAALLKQFVLETRKKPYPFSSSPALETWLTFEVPEILVEQMPTHVLEVRMFDTLDQVRAAREVASRGTESSADLASTAGTADKAFADELRQF